MNKKVAIVSPAYPYRGGQALVEAYLFDVLTSLGFECFTISYKLLYPSLFFPGTTQFDKSGKIYNDHQDRTARIINSVNPLSWLKAAKEIKKSDPGVVVVVWWIPFLGPALSMISYLVKKWTKAKIVFLIENYISHENRWFDVFSSRFTLRKADYFISQSNYIFNQLKIEFPETPVHETTLPIFDCYNYNQFTKQQARKFLEIETQKVVLFFGYIRAYKGLDNLISAFSLVLERLPDTTLLIVGECYEDKQKYTELLKRVKVAHKTKFISKYVPNEEVEVYFKAADVTCLPYNAATQSGIVMMSYGFRIPVVTTDVGGLPQFVIPNETGIIVPRGNISKLADAIYDILEMRGRIEFEKNIAAFVEKLGYRNLEKIFFEIASNESVM